MKRFMAVGAACKLLRVSRPQLQNLFPYLPHVYITKRQTRMFVSTYIEAYAQNLVQNKSATIESARTFARSEMAKQLVQHAQAEFEQELNSRIMHSANDVAALFCVGRMTITGWYQAGVFDPIVHTIYPKRDRGKGRKRLVGFSREQVRSAYEWRLPQQ